MNKEVSKTRKDIQREELQRSPIFLLQKGRVELNDEVLFDNNVNYDTDGIIDIETGEYLTDDQLIEKDFGHVVFDNTEGVFLTREEAERYVKKYSYNYGRGLSREHRDWRVFCVSCIGRLDNILNELNSSVLEPEIGKTPLGK
ncbi:MAG TPA: hypothetical protein VIH27_04850 [Nitrososphaerales archaeon]